MLKGLSGFSRWNNDPWSSFASAGSTAVQTALGTAQGVVDVSGVNRFAVRYASADRWQPSTIAATWELPNGSTNASAVPLMCPQPSADSSTYSEDCLSMILYVPATLTASSGAPTFMWIHGGSFMVGSATGAGLDGSALAKATNSIVAVIQYRLGALGFVAPNGQTNLGLKDAVNAMQFLNNVVPAFGGSASKITIAGQSSGANMIRALLAVPSADSLFQSAILQSDPMDYGFLSTSDQSQIQDYFVSQLNCSATDASCLNGLSADSIVNGAGLKVFSDAYTVVPAANQAEPMRVVYDNSFVTSTLDSSTPFPKVSKPIVLSNVLDEAALTIYGYYTSSVSESEYEQAVNGTFGTPRTQVLLSSQLYASDAQDSAEDYRPMLETLGTDSIWRCATWTFARNWVANGGTAYVGMYTLGASYPGNSAVGYCTEEGVVCHQDDIEIVFGTVPSPSAAQTSLVNEMQARYESFMANGNPNPSGSSYTSWQAATSSDVNAINLGSSGLTDVGACTTSFWGASVQYDYQVYSI
ncbi:alpha beta-hydrolase [Coniophora puteana RWD-64-598 SS2]|uniref:Carboxylic ester hydrolase n=1 Tax=Coniophora puteana (strain RWD-64-598) TaxID=741705 RepID=A0A5M3N0E0_CONPW|nr:alpha beta-hydrolase [Coniophora puteana RWD-64-598 SS2]EIW84838.1 alpha beta-hydrolase [Coniophora puteana RWD-64-598 SS2]